MNSGAPQQSRRNYGIPGSTGALVPLFAIVPLLLMAVLVYGMSRPLPDAPVTIGAYATDLQARTPHQQFNARRAAAAIDGAVIAPGAQFSFNRLVGGWSADRGYLKAPVSYDGVLVDDYGGGVCETSTTIYNAALIGGLSILERHPHTFAPSYAPVGRDAAVAFPGIDLRLRNPYAYPVTVRVREDGHMLVCRFMARAKALPRVEISSQTEEIVPAPAGFLPPGDRRTTSRWHLEGRDGYHVLVYREMRSVQGQNVTQLVSDDSYMPLSAVRRSRD
jgi:vancomycin resistance protein VanW